MAHKRYRRNPLRCGYLVSLDGRWFGQFDNRFDSVFLFSDTALIRQFIHLHTALTEPRHRCEREALLSPFLEQFAAHLPKSSEATRSFATPLERNGIAAARQYLRENFASPVTLGELSQQAGLTSAYFCRAFRREVGLPPLAYQTSVRIAHARNLLAAGTPIARVAAMTGFFDQAHLTRIFARYWKITPGKYARGMHDLPSSAALE